MKYKIIHDRNKCIGCGACVSICPGFWEMGDDNKSILKGASVAGSKFELELDKIECNDEAAENCPVKCIKVEKEE